MSAKTGGELIADYLIEQGVPYVCGIPGHGDMGIFDAFKDRADRITVLQARHEQSAGHIADAYYRACGRPLATLTSIGPGSANLTMALATAYVDSQAVIAITGGVQSYMDGTGVLQELERQHDADFPSVLRPVVKRGFSVHRVDQLPRALHRAFNVALDGRPGPVHIDVPIDVQALAGEGHRLDAGRHRATHPVAHPDPEGIEQIAAALVGAARPVILAGGGCIQAGAHAELRHVAELVQAPVLATMMGKGIFPEDHPLAAEHTGANGTICGNHFSREADVLLAVGTRFAEQTASSYEHGESFAVPPDADPADRRRPARDRQELPRRGRRRRRRAHRPGGRSPMPWRSGATRCPDRREYILESASWKGRWRAMIRERWNPGVLSMSQAIHIAAQDAAARGDRDRLGRAPPDPDVPGVRLLRAAHVDHAGRLLDDGLHRAGRDRREAREARRAGRRRRRRRGLPDEHPGARARGAGGDLGRVPRAQQHRLDLDPRLPARHVRCRARLRRRVPPPPRRRADHAPTSPRSPTGFGATAFKVTELEQLRPALEAALRTEGPVVIEAMLARDPRSTEGINAGHWDLPKPAYLAAGPAS